MFMVVPPKRMYVMQGIPGSGKSTLARILKDSVVFEKTDVLTSVILSTDDYWTKDMHALENVWADGRPVPTTYEFDPARLGEAHAWNQRRTVGELAAGTNYVFIDNTNILKSHAAPYFALASMYEYEVSVVRVDVELSVALGRNRQRPFNRRVPEDTVRKMYETMERLV